MRSHSRESGVDQDFENLLLSSVDLAFSLGSLFEAHPPSSEVFHCANGEFTIRLAHFYHNCLNALDEKINEEEFKNNVPEEKSKLFTKKICLAKSKVLQIVRMTITRCILAPVMNQHKNGDNELEILLQLYTGYLSEPSFFKDYLYFHALDDDLDIFKQLGIQVDPMRIEYLRDGIILHKEHVAFPNEVKADSSNVIIDGATSMIESPDESLISRVKDLFPQLGDGFLAQCLPYYDNDAEKVINALLEDNLPPHLENLDKTKDKTVKVTDAGPAAICDTIEDMELSKLHRGKRKVAKNANALLDDKKDLNQMKDRFNALSIVTDDIYLNPGDAEYDDEYDDTYDENAMGEAEPDALETGREFVLPRALGGGHVSHSNHGRNDNGNDEDEDSDTDQKPKLDFARNPEEIRQENEQRRQSKMAREQKKPYNKPRDVVGNPKGQGQDKNVQINRARKNANKNKNHRAMAEKKMAKGMF